MSNATICFIGSYITGVSFSTVWIFEGFVKPISNGIGWPFILVWLYIVIKDLFGSPVP